jgi:hypothetical protein
MKYINSCAGDLKECWGLCSKCVCKSKYVPWLQLLPVALIIFLCGCLGCHYLLYDGRPRTEHRTSGVQDPGLHQPRGSVPMQLSPMLVVHCVLISLQLGFQLHLESVFHGQLRNGFCPIPHSWQPNSDSEWHYLPLYLLLWVTSHCPTSPVFWGAGSSSWDMTACLCSGPSEDLVRGHFADSPMVSYTERSLGG